MIVNGIRPRSLRRRLGLVFFGAMLVLAAGVLAPQARADSIGEYADKNAAEICLMLQHQPSIAGVDYVVGQLLEHHLAPEPAAAVLLLSVNTLCPWYSGLVYAWANQAVAPSVSEVYRA